MIKVLTVLFMMVSITACSDEQHPVDGDHVWKEQTDTMDKAQDVEKVILDSAQQKKQQLEQALD